MTSSLSPVFKFKREAYAVRVENVAESVSRREIVELFNSLIGDVRKCEEAFDDNRRILTLSFSTQDAAKKALCMSGYTVAGVPLTVKVPLPSEGHRIIKQGKQLDVRRNLYVLGLPFDLTKSEFAEIFSHYGS
ncbi:hypothetical protein A0H81_12591 [Grifola frondosa]|uniref:RRM domain-containing protein n=1 Tax=Grifola frondosa TaxID=5627 RepID=A0A1C7LTF5_GRIFR|nr:hypothetical protein A0H81_12591 [Grifola frondosa]